MRTRTRLTTPPGQEPVEEVGPRSADQERYTHGLGLPVEPTVPSRLQRPVVFAASLVLLVALGFIAFRLSSVGQYEDPALFEAPAPELPGEQDAPPEGAAEPAESDPDA